MVGLWNKNNNNNKIYIHIGGAGILVTKKISQVSRSMDLPTGPRHLTPSFIWRVAVLRFGLFLFLALLLEILTLFQPTVNFATQGWRPPKPSHGCGGPPVAHGWS